MKYGQNSTEVVTESTREIRYICQRRALDRERQWAKVVCTSLRFLKVSAAIVLRRYCSLVYTR